MRCRGLAWYPVVPSPIARRPPVWLPVLPLGILCLADVAVCLTSDLGLLPDRESFVAVTEFLSPSEWPAQEVSVNNFKILFEAYWGSSQSPTGVRYQMLHPVANGYLVRGRLRSPCGRAERWTRTTLRAPACMRCRGPELGLQSADLPIPRQIAPACHTIARRLVLRIRFPGPSATLGVYPREVLRGAVMK